MSEIIQIFSQLVSNIGFPIACVVAMFILLNKEREERHKDNESIKEAISNNTEVMKKLLTKIGGEKND